MTAAVKRRIFGKAVRAPAFVHEAGTRKVFENRFQVMSRSAVAAQPPVFVEGRKERASPALSAFDVLSLADGFVGPLCLIQTLGGRVGPMVGHDGVFICVHHRNPLAIDETPLSNVKTGTWFVCQIDKRRTRSVR